MARVETHKVALAGATIGSVMMRFAQISVAFSAAALICGCTTAVYFVSERPAPGGDGIYRYKASDGSAVSLGPTYQAGCTPHIALDGALLYVKPVGGTNQVFRGTQQLTTSPGDRTGLHSSRQYPRSAASYSAVTTEPSSSRLPQA